MIITWNNDGDRADLIHNGVCLLQCRCSGDLRPALRIPGDSAAWSNEPAVGFGWMQPPASSDRADVEAALRQEAELRTVYRRLGSRPARMHGALRVLSAWEEDGLSFCRRWGAVKVAVVLQTDAGFYSYYPEASRPRWLSIKGAADPADARELATLPLVSMECYYAPEAT